MARPRRCRRICQEPAYDQFIPGGFAGGDSIYLSVDEYEVIRLIDYERLTHEQCGRQMDISRTTVTEIYGSAREKLAACLVDGRPLVISGGHYKLCEGGETCQIRPCRKAESKIRKPVLKKGEQEMRIAVTYESGMIFQHFGHTSQFKIYDIEDNQITKSQVVDTEGQGHGALSGFLSDLKTDILICGGIGGGAQSALAEAGIQLYGGAKGSADEAVQAYLDGTLSYDANVQCSHHGEEHHHSCGEHKHGCHGA